MVGCAHSVAIALGMLGGLGCVVIVVNAGAVVVMHATSVVRRGVGGGGGGGADGFGRGGALARDLCGELQAACFGKAEAGAIDDDRGDRRAPRRRLGRPQPISHPSNVDEQRAIEQRNVRCGSSVRRPTTRLHRRR